MYKKVSVLSHWTLLILLAGLFSCKNATDTAPFSVTIRLPNEPESLHPIFSKSLYATQIEGLILMPIAEYDPVSLNLSPLLITEIPKGEKVTEGKHANGKVFKLQFRPEATWADGKPVTGEDYLFTIKSVYNPHFNAGSWRGQFDFISDIEMDPSDPKKVSVYFDERYFLDLETSVNFNLYPAHIYDPEKILSQFTLEQLRTPDTLKTAEQDSLLKRFALRFESPIFFRDTVTGSGQYELDQWMTGEYTRLKRKTDWWGDKIKDAPLLMQAYPTEITYRVILDAAAAEAALKSGEIDLMAEAPVSSFVTMRQDSTWKEKLQFTTPSLMQINYVEINTRNPILSDPKVRQALAATIDYDGILNNVMQGFAERTVGPIHPGKNYYDKDLQPVKQDINRALTLLQEAGWKDTNGDGIPDKKIDGKQQDLKLKISLANKEEGMAIANIIKENAKKAGFEIELDVIDPTELQQRVRQNNFELMPLRIRSFPSLDDPSTLWHSSNDKPGGSNRSGFHTPELDQLIDALRTTEDEKQRDQYYKSFQELLYKEQPAIFLYVPLERIIASKRIEVLTSPRRPGYFENLLKPAGS